MKIAEQQNLIYEPENSDVYHKAVELYNAGFHITVLHNHEKAPWKNEAWNKIRCAPEVGMTGVGIVTGTTCNIYSKLYYVLALDIDIYRKERRENILSIILEQIGKPVYLEETASGGNRIIFYCENLIVNKSKKFDFSEANDAAQHKDNVEYFASGKQVVIAPSKAENKDHDIGKYKQISEVGLMESAVLTEYEVKSLLQILQMLSNSVYYD